jgi:hypothetical protein
LEDINQIRWNKSFSISGWFKSTNSQDSQTIFAQTRDSDRFTIQLKDSGTELRVSWNLQGEGSGLQAIRSSSNLPLNSYYYFTYIYYGNKSGNLYINGVIDNSGTNNPSASGTTATTIGSVGNPTFFFNGSIDDVQIYDYALTGDEITAQYELGRGNYALKGTVAQYSSRDYEGTEANPTSITDTRYITYDTITRTNRLKFNYSESTYLEGGLIYLDFFPDKNATISFFTNTTSLSRYIFNLWRATTNDRIAHNEYVGFLESGVYDETSSDWKTTKEIITNYNELRNIVFDINENILSSNFYYDGSLQETDSDSMSTFDF